MPQGAHLLLEKSPWWHTLCHHHLTWQDDGGTWAGLHRSGGQQSIPGVQPSTRGLIRLGNPTTELRPSFNQGQLHVGSPPRDGTVGSNVIYQRKPQTPQSFVPCATNHDGKKPPPLNLLVKLTPFYISFEFFLAPQDTEGSRRGWSKAHILQEPAKGFRRT